MRAGIITHYNVHNHGAHLQLYALSECLRSLGYEAKALRFEKNYDFMGGAEAGKKYNISLRSIPTYIKYIRENGLGRTLYNIRKRKTLARFRQAHDLIGGYYSEALDLDAVVIGSDEIFSIEAGPNPWYYGIGVPCTKQISYAASFGPTSLKLIREHNVTALVKAGLEHLSSISVRDRNSADIVEYFTGKRPEIVCDPVLLYDFSEEASDEKVTAFRKRHPEKYCIVYSYDYNMNDEKTVRAIGDFAQKRGLKVYSVAYYHGWCDNNINPDPLDIFAWFTCSEMVFTDTFHGSVLSLVTGAQFISFIRGNGNKLAFLLEQYGVEERKVEDFGNIEAAARKLIDYSVVNRRILELRGQSMDYLRRALECHDNG